MSEHPKLCKHKEKCKFLKKNICAFSHDLNEKENIDIQGDTEIIIKIANLKRLVSENKVENESKVKSLAEAIDIERKKNQEHDNVKKSCLRRMLI